MRYLNATMAGMMMAMLASVSYAESVSAKRGLTLEGAKKVIAATVAAAKKINAPGGSIAVVDDGGNLLALERLDQTFAPARTLLSERRAPRHCSRNRPRSSKMSLKPDVSRWSRSAAISRTSRRSKEAFCSNGKGRSLEQLV